MTVWTFQEYCDATNSWAVQVMRLTAPPPATPASATPATLCQGLAVAGVTVTGNTLSGSGFFDPGADAGVSFPYQRLTASINGGVAVNGVAFTSPTQITLSVSTTGAPTGPKDVMVTNPDGQSLTGTGILSVTPQPAPPGASNSGQICDGDALQLSASTVAGAIYSWTGPGGFASSQQNPSIPAASAATAGVYSVTVTVAGCTSTAQTTSVSVIPNGGACSDGNACTTADSCLGGACQAGPLRDGDSDGRVDALCGGSDCNDADPFVWSAPREVTNLEITTASPATVVWDNQTLFAGPGTRYDLVSGGLDGTGLHFSPATCLQSAGVTTCSDARPRPAVGTGFWYLARGRSSCGIGTYGSTLRDASIPPCP